ncbi:MAG TPA: DUF885 domain-containing protein [Candidatus Dormibacteraeota bacterium]|jgi:uncharacterized protein (DUF885 family)|nr:DUF885 domain-containing protein [Candidatus Dormibacteraeota bacterium]
MSPDPSTASALCERVVREAFALEPALARWSGDHTYDGVVGDIGPDALRHRVETFQSLIDELDGVPLDRLDAATRADVLSARAFLAEDVYRTRELRVFARDPRRAIDVSADVSSYVSRDYAPAPDRAAAVARHLEQLPAFLEQALPLLDEEVWEGPRTIAIDGARGFAAFMREDVRRELGPLDGALARRLDAAVEIGAAACEAYATRVEALRPLPDSALGADAFVALLEAQEGIRESVESLRRRADDELERLGAQTVELAGRLAPGRPVAESFTLMEADHPSADELLPATEAMLDRLRDFWIRSGVISVPADAHCEVRPTPAFRRWSSASYEAPGPLDPPGMAHYYFITTVQPDWSAEQAEQWLRSLNHVALENVSVHEAFPGHFVHFLNGYRNPSLVRRVFGPAGFIEGWAHYTEQLAIEQGLAEGRPLLHLAQLQDALLRACRFRAAVGLHCEGMPLEEATRLFEERAYMQRLPAEREALRGTYDPLYLVYTYGKLEILRWREELSRRPGWDARRFHDTLTGAAFPPLAVARDLVLG